MELISLTVNTLNVAADIMSQSHFTYIGRKALKEVISRP
jgi:hypothetical protein